MSTRAEREADTKTKERHQKILKELMARPENRKCADCRKKDPRWCSHNLGIFMCIKCSGVHRSLGTHISKVKSADLDTWVDEQIQVMARWGNARANMYWEAKLPKGFQPPEGKIDEFIRDKYQWRKYAAEGPIPDPETLNPGQPSAAPTGIAAPSQTQQNSPQIQNVPVSQTKATTPDLLDITSATQPQQTKSDIGDLFILPPSQQEVKNNILSLYNTAPPQPTQTPNIGAFTNFDAFPAPQPAVTNMTAFNHLAPSTNGQVSSGSNPAVTGTNAFAEFGNFSNTQTNSQQAFAGFADFGSASNQSNVNNDGWAAFK